MTIGTVHAGMLRQRIEIQERTDVQDAQGGVTPTYTTTHTLWGEVRPSKGDEFLNARGQVIATVTHTVTTRYLAGITTLHRLKFGDRFLGILSVIDTEERRRVLRFLCKEVVAGGVSS